MPTAAQDGLPGALVAALAVLRCPVCGSGLAAGRPVRCPRGHAFDVARQGYLNLAVGAAADTGDSAAMVAARDRFLAAGWFAPLTGALAAAAEGPVVVDIGGGTGHHLAAVLGTDDRRLGICLDRSPAALRRAAGVHPRVAAVGCDVWQGLPLVDGGVDTVLDVFAPRNIAEISRVLTPHGRLVLATPTSRHLVDVVGPLGMIGVDPGKDDRLAGDLADWTVLDEYLIEHRELIDRTGLADLVLMGPSAHHLTSLAVRERAVALPDPCPVTVSVRVQVLTR